MQLKFKIIFLFLVLSALNSWAQTPELIFPATHYAGSVAISPDDKWLVSVSGNEVKIWDNETARLIKNIKFAVNFDGLINETGVIAISPDSKTAAFQNADSLFFFNFDKFDFDRKLYLSNPLQEMVFSADSKTLYGGGHMKEKYDDMVVLFYRRN